MINKRAELTSIEEVIGMCKAFRALLEEMEGAENPDFFKSVCRVAKMRIKPEKHYKSHGEYLTKSRECLIDKLTKKINFYTRSTLDYEN